MTNKVIRQASQCSNCVPQNSRFFKQKSNGKIGWDKMYPKIFIY